MKRLLFSFLSAFSLVCFAQNDAIDSLELRLEDKLSVVERVNTLHAYVWELSFYNPKKSIEPAQESLSLAQKLNDSSLISVSYNRIGLVHDYAGNFSLAEKNYLIAYSIKKSCDGEQETDGLLNNLGSIYYYMGDFEKSMKFYLKSLKIRELKKNQEDSKSLKNIAQSYNNIGLLLKSQQNYREALNYYTKALQIKNKLNDVPGLIVTHSNLGVIYMELDSLVRSESEFKSAVLLSDSIKDFVSKAMLYNNIGLLYNRNEAYSKAKDYYWKSLELYEKIEDLHGKSTALINLSSISFTEGDTKTARNLAEKSLEIGRANNSPEVIMTALQLLAEINSGEKPRLALQYLNEYTRLKDSINDVKITNKVNQLAVMYETEKKETEIDLLKKEQQIIQADNNTKDLLISRNNTYVLLLVIGLVLSLVLSYFIFRYLRSKKRLVEEKAEKTYEKFQREIDTLRINIERQVDFSTTPKESQKVDFNEAELNAYLLNPLSERELEVLNLISNGSTNKVVAEKLFISVNTVKTHVLKIYEKLDVKNRTAAASKANSLNIIQ